MTILKRFLDPIRYYCFGKGNPWRLILVWFILLNIIAFSVGLLVLGITDLFEHSSWLTVRLIILFLLLITATLGMVITFVYPIIFIYALWNSAANTQTTFLKYLARFLIIPFILIHFFLGGAFYFFGSGIMWVGAQKIYHEIGLYERQEFK